MLGLDGSRAASTGLFRSPAGHHRMQGGRPREGSVCGARSGVNDAEVPWE
jgi:hypothetical protein